MKTTKILLVIVCLIFPLSPTTAQSGNDDWVQKTLLTKPTARDWHAMAFIGNGKVLLYGGDTGSKNDETWLYDLGTNTWERKYPSNSPGARCNHAMAYLGDDRVLMFGGSDVTYTHTSSCWRYDLSDNNWIETAPPTRPAARRYHAMAYIGDGKILMVSGDGEGGYLDDAWLYDVSDPNQWSAKTPFTQVKWHSMSYIGNDQILLTGGQDGDGKHTWNYLYDLSDNIWTSKAALSLPDVRSNMVYLGNQKTMLFGGYDWSGFRQANTYIFDLGSNSWSTDANATNPSAREDYRMTETSIDGSSYMVLFGGNTGTRNDETWTFGGGNLPLPVELTSFTANFVDGNVLLNWQTVTEVDNYGFEVEKSVSRAQSAVSHWAKVGFIAGAGNSNTSKNYSFIDSDVTSGKYFYRLKQINTNGSFEYSNEIEIEITQPKEFSLYQNYPNPFNPSTTIKYSIPSLQTPLLGGVGFVTLKVYDILGNEVAMLENEKKSAGNYEVKFDASNLASGIYLYKLQSGEFVSVKKLMLLK